MEKRVRFRSLTLPWLLLAPQLAAIGAIAALLTEATVVVEKSE